MRVIHSHSRAGGARVARVVVPLLVAVLALACLAPAVVSASTGVGASLGAGTTTDAGPSAVVASATVAPAANGSTTDSGGSVTTAAATTVSACRTIDAPGVYALSADLSASSGDCLVVTASDVVLDGRGHVVAETGGGNDTGVSVGGGVLTSPSNVTVRNLVVEDWAVGVGGSFVDRFRVENVTVDGGGTGVSLSLVSNATVREVHSGATTPERAVQARATSNLTVRGLDHRAPVDGRDAPPAVDVEGRDVAVRNSSLTCTGTCVEVANASGVTVSGVTVTGAGDDGVFAESSTGVRVVDSTVANASADGVKLTSIEDARVANVDVTAPDDQGITIFGGTNHTLVDVHVTDADSEAVRVLDVTGLRMDDVVAVAPENGFALDSLTDARVEGVEVVDAGRIGVFVRWSDVSLSDVRVDGYSSAGLFVEQALRFEPRNVVVDGFTVRNPAADAQPAAAVRTYARHVTLRNGRTVGGDTGILSSGANLTVANVTAVGVRNGVRVGVDEETTLREVTVRNATDDAVVLETAGAGEGTFEDLHVSNPGGAAVNVTAGPVRLDNLTTDGGRVSAVVRRAALLEPSGAPATGERVRVATVGFDPVAAGTGAVELAVRYDPVRVNESTVALYRAGSFSWTAVPDAAVERDLDLVTANLTTAGIYSVQARAGESLPPPPGPSCPTVSGTPATNVDEDPACEDVDGDGDVDLDDAFTLAFEVVPDPPADPTPFDFDGDGDVDLDDVFALAFSR